MSKEKVRLAVFDFDGTLTTGHLWIGLWKHHREHREKTLGVYFYLASHLPFWLLSKTGLYSVEKDRSRWGEGLSALVKGFSVSQAEEAFKWIRDNYFAPLMRKDMLERIGTHRSAGDRVVLLSGMFQEFLDLVGQNIGAEYIIGTRLELAKGIYTGRIIKPLCFGENKARLLVERMKTLDLDVDWQASTSYADSYFDFPVFKLVGHPVATYPDDRLRKIAEAGGWPIIAEATHSGKPN